MYFFTKKKERKKIACVISAKNRQLPSPGTLAPGTKNNPSSLAIDIAMSTDVNVLAMSLRW